ncbi:hypothetical protein EDC44_11721 [Cricetibacter osteomyelitidis]|uniref:Uncharacterized protein n=1 Tax=Cricetibacter osteomyelitidis TaxID=1521931 RepID=A0A4R2SX86_9PAST|nr:hypothetical protein EDC44_11721 [Cricetibacter osteomyelitidis]
MPRSSWVGFHPTFQLNSLRQLSEIAVFLID